MNIKVERNEGIISIGKHINNTITTVSEVEKIDWERLTREVEALKTSSDLSVKEFASDAFEGLKEKDAGKIKNWLLKWIPCIGNLIQTSYYIMELVSRFGIK